MGVVHLKLKPNEFWELSPYEFKLFIKQHKESHQSRVELVGLNTWYNGVSGNSDLNRIGMKRWMESFQDPDKVKEQRKETLDTGKELWKQFKRGKI